METVKTTLAAALLVALLTAAAATTVITTTVDGPREQQQKECQLQGRRCQEYLVQGGRTRLSTLGCCLQLGDVDKQCRCEAIKIAVRQVLEEGLAEGQEAVQVLDRATYLISNCNIVPYECKVRVIFV